MSVPPIDPDRPRARVYLMRHGPAEDWTASRSDEDRALTPAGRTRVRRVAQVMAERNEKPSRIFGSPLVRAAQTAELVAEVIGLDGARCTASPDLRPGRSIANVVESLALVYESASLLLVSHEPDLSFAVGQLTGVPLPVPFDKAMLVALDPISEGTKGPSPRSARWTPAFYLDPISLVVVPFRPESP